jgi:hypothetical protein
MKHFYLLFFFLGIYTYAAKAQCSGCLVNDACTVTPIAPTLCPSTLPDAISGQYYEMDVTFFMPQQFNDPGSGFNVTLSSIVINAISGLPPGLDATTNDADNIFEITADPATQRGCVRICGTPTAIGSYTVSVNITANVSAPISTTVAQSFTLPISVTPGTSGNSGFSFSPAQGCDSLQVEFQALITSSAQPVTYSWDFGNGTTSTSALPETQFYLQPDTYTVQLQTQLLDYVVNAVSFTVTGNNWCGDIEEPNIFGCIGSPDVFYNLTVGGATTTGPTTSNSTNYNHNTANVTVSGTAFSIQFYDEDTGLSQNDDLGTAVVQIDGPGTYPFTTSNGFGNVTVNTVVSLSFTHTDTVIVHPSPTSPELSASALSVCEGDSILLSLPESAFYQWYDESGLINGANNDSLWVFASGIRSAEIRNESGCVAFSDTLQLSFLDFPEPPSIFFNPIAEQFIFNPGAGYNWVWLLDGDTLQGTDNLSALTPLVPGNYSVTVATNGTNCALSSNSLFFTNASTTHAPLTAGLRIWPQPWQAGSLNVQLPQSMEGKTVQLRILDLSGRMAFSENIKHAAALLTLDGLNLVQGLYFLSVSTTDTALIQRFVVSSSGFSNR